MARQPLDTALFYENEVVVPQDISPEFLQSLVAEVAAIDSVLAIIYGACRMVAKVPAQLRARLWREEQRDTRADQRTYNKGR